MHPYSFLTETMTSTIFFCIFLLTLGGLKSTVGSKKPMVDTACQLLDVLQSQGIPQEERDKWLCLAYLESRLDSSHRMHMISSNGCSSERFGIFGLASPWCKEPGCPGICDTNCIEFVNNTLESVKCLRKSALLSSPWETCSHVFRGVVEDLSKNCPKRTSTNTARITTRPRPFRMDEDNKSERFMDLITGRVILIALGTVGGVLLLICALCVGWNICSRVTSGCRKRRKCRTDLYTAGRPIVAQQSVMPYRARPVVVVPPKSNLNVSAPPMSSGGSPTVPKPEENDSDYDNVSNDGSLQERRLPLVSVASRTTGPTGNPLERNPTIGVSKEVSAPTSRVTGYITTPRRLSWYEDVSCRIS